MPAKIKAFYDKECTEELLRDSKSCAILFTYFKKNKDGTITPYVSGIDGESGEVVFYLKNVGTRAALHPKLVFKETNHKYLLENTVFNFPDMAVDAIQEVKIKFTVKPWTAAQISENMFSIDYYSLPDATTDVNPYNQYSAIADETNTNVIIETV